MPIRYQPENDQMPPGMKGGKYQTRPARLVYYEELRPSFIRRLVRRLFSLPVIIPLVVVAAVVLGVLVYYWTVFSGRIDNLLKGEVYTRSAGIYAAPKQIRVGETLSVDDLIAYLKIGRAHV